MEKSEIKQKIMENEDFIHAPKYQNSLQKFLAKVDKIPENHSIGKLLQMPTEEVEKIYQESVAELRKGMIHEESTD